MLLSLSLLQEILKATSKCQRLLPADYSLQALVDITLWYIHMGCLPARSVISSNLAEVKEFCVRMKLQICLIIHLSCGHRLNNTNYYYFLLSLWLWS